MPDLVQAQLVGGSRAHWLLNSFSFKARLPRHSLFSLKNVVLTRESQIVLRVISVDCMKLHLYIVYSQNISVLLLTNS